MTISPAKLKVLADQMAKLDLSEKDIDEHFVRSQGAGGQKVNKTSSCVVLHHRPTGVQVKCQISRSQADNRYFARRILFEKIAAQKEGERSAHEQAVAKIRRQKRRRSQRAKEKLLANKRHQAEKKQRRGRVMVDI